MFHGPVLFGLRIPEYHCECCDSTHFVEDSMRWLQFYDGNTTLRSIADRAIDRQSAKGADIRHDQDIAA
jgi:hypothetical protein